jgi:hypothetical protein
VAELVRDHRLELDRAEERHEAAGEDDVRLRPEREQDGVRRRLALRLVDDDLRFHAEQAARPCRGGVDLRMGPRLEPVRRPQQVAADLLLVLLAGLRGAKPAPELGLGVPQVLGERAVVRKRRQHC